MKNVIITLLVEGTEQEIAKIKSDVICASSNNLKSMQITDIEQEEKEIKLFSFMENKENESVRV